MKIAKMMDGKIVEIVRVANKVAFSDKEGWILIYFDFHKPFHKREQSKWISAYTPFMWVRDMIDVSEK